MDKFDLWKKVISLREEFGVDTKSPIDIFALLYKINYLTIVFYPMGDKLSGMCIRDQLNKVIAINSTMSIGRQRFSIK